MSCIRIIWNGWRVRPAGAPRHLARLGLQRSRRDRRDGWSRSARNFCANWINSAKTSLEQCLKENMFIFPPSACLIDREAFEGERIDERLSGYETTISSSACPRRLRPECLSRQTPLSMADLLFPSSAPTRRHEKFRYRVLAKAVSATLTPFTRSMEISYATALLHGL